MENNYKQEFIEIYNKYITRRGADKLLEWIEKTDFFTAPASTKYHGHVNQDLSCTVLMFTRF